MTVCAERCTQYRYRRTVPGHFGRGDCTVRIAFRSGSKSCFCQIAFALTEKSSVRRADYAVTKHRHTDWLIC